MGAESLVNRNDIESMINSYANEQVDFLTSDFYISIVEPIKQKVNSYVSEFNMAFTQWASNNSVLRQMKYSLDPLGHRSDKIKLATSKYQNQKQSTLNLMSVMDKGHSLLLEIRTVFTGQVIKTKFIVQAEGRMYIIDEDVIQPELILSSWGGSTASNPFSLAYSIDIDLLKSKNLLIKENEVGTADIWSQIWANKLEYLAEKEAYWKTQGQERHYKPYFDSKDAEIYYLYSTQKQTVLNLTDYKTLRKTVGGGGGYRTPFFRGGDVGDIQIKFANLDKSNRVSINFARFSLLRDRFAELEKIFATQNPIKMKQALQQFFIEKTNNNVDQAANILNQKANEKLDELFQIFV